MLDWKRILYERLPLPEMKDLREERIFGELADHLEDLYREALARGADRAAAEEEALAKIGDLDRVVADLLLTERVNVRPELDRLSEEVEGAMRRKGGVWVLFADLWQDLRFSLRTHLKAPSFLLVTVLTLAAGIGASTAVFSVVEGVLLRPLPYPDADRLVVPRTVDINQGNRYNTTYPDFLLWREHDVFERVAIFAAFQADMTGEGDPARVAVMEVGDGYFETVRIGAIRGRVFRDDEHLPGTERTALLSSRFWQSRFDSDPDVVGRMIRIRDVPHTIIGIVPDEAASPMSIDVWTPFQPDITAVGIIDWDNHAFTAIARLKGDETLRSTGARLADLAAQVAEEYPGLRGGETIIAVPLLKFVTGSNLNTALWSLLTAVCFVLLIGCLNIANLILAKASHRGRELTVRNVLGAGRFRLIRQLIAENLLLALSGGAVGVLLSVWLLRGLTAIAPPGVPRIEATGLNGTVLVFALAVSIASVMVFGLIPALRATSDRNISDIHEGSARLTAGRRERMSRNILIGIELALSLLLLAGAGYTLRSLSRVNRAEMGFDYGNLLRVPITLPTTRYEPGGDRVRGFFEQLVEEVAVLPGVTSATIRSAMPLGGGGFYLTRAHLREGEPEPPEGQEINATWTIVGRRHFETMGIPILKGRDFDLTDAAESAPVMIVNQLFAEAMFGDEDPVGRRVRSWRDENIYREIVGVVGNVRYFNVGDAARNCIYVPHAQASWRAMSLVVKTGGDPTAAVDAIRGVVNRLDPELVVAGVTTMEDVFSNNLAGTRFISFLLMLFASIALFLAAIGIFAVLSYLVSRRTREIGVRMAVGATRGDVVRLVVKDSLWVVLIGISAGLLLLLLLGRFMRNLLFEVSSFEPVVFATVCLILAAVALLATVIPAWRAVKVDPMEALRLE